jgi:hypothetical protein
VKTLLLDKNIVINGNFNPSEFDRYFLIKNNIINEEAISKMRVPPVFSYFECSFETEVFKVSVFPNRLMVSSIDLEDKANDIESFTLSILNVLNFKQVINFGINFDYVFDLESTDRVKEFSKKLFYSSDLNLFANFFNEDNCNYGTYVSKNVLKSRLKLDVKPIRNIIKELKVIDLNGLIFKYNFHFESDAGINSITEFKVYYDECKKINSFIVNLK